MRLKRSLERCTEFFKHAPKKEESTALFAVKALEIALVDFNKCFSC